MAGGYTEVPYAGFGGGLNLRDQPDVIKPEECFDCLNVEFTERGAVKQRPGFTKFTTVAGTNRYDSMAVHYETDGTKQLVVGAGNRLEALNTSGGIVASSILPTANPHFFTRFGGPAAEVTFAANGTDQLRQWDGAAWSTPVWTGTAPDGKFVAVDATSNRLVNARRVGTTAGDNPSTVRFADAGVPTTWGANNFVDLTPGDGEEIMGVVSWREYVFVFKQSKFFVFTGEGVDETGNPTFDFRPVEAGVGLVASRALAVAREGVYFLDRTGVYRTNGGEPQFVSGHLEGLFAETAPSFYSGDPVRYANLGLASMVWHDERIYLSVPTTAATNDRVFVLDPRYSWWSVYSLKAAAMASFRVGDQANLMFAFASGTNDIGRVQNAATDDAGTNISSFWNGGWWDHGVLDVHVVKEHKLWGSGTVISSLATDYESAATGSTVAFTTDTDTWGDGTGADTWGDGTGTDLWGGGVTLEGKLARRAVRGAVFSLQFQNVTGGAWAVHRAVMRVRESWIPQATRG